MGNVKFFFTSDFNKYKNLETKDSMALYFVEDKSIGYCALYKGENLIAIGSDATSMAGGLMSKEDKIALDALIASQGSSTLTPVDGTITISDSKIGVAISAQDGNALQKVTDGLFVPSVSIPEFTMEKQSVAEGDFLSTYKLKKTENGVDTYCGDSINIPKANDKYLQSATLKIVEEDGVPYTDAKIGDRYIDMAFNDESASHIYVPMPDISGDVTTEIKIDEANANGLSYIDGTGLALTLATSTTAGAMSAVDKVALDKLVALDIPTTYGMAYEVSNKPEGTLVNYNGKEIRVMCPADTEWALQNVGEGGDSSKYYIGFKAYAPSSNVASFKESLATTMTDQTMYYFEGNDFAGIDANGRKYSIVWLPVAKHNDDDTWTYYGNNSSSNKFIGWNYCVEWYNASGVCVASDLIRINLANEDCVHSVEPYYMSSYVTDTQLETAIADVSASISWGEL